MFDDLVVINDVTYRILLLIFVRVGEESLARAR